MENTKHSKLNTILEQFTIVIYVYILIIGMHMIFTKSNFKEIILAAFTSCLMVMLSIILKNLISKPDLPGFAWGTLVSFILTLPVSPIQTIILENMKAFSFSMVGLPLLAFAGISVGNQLGVLKKLSWKIVLISMVVMASTYFGSAIISSIVLKMANLI